MNKKLTLEQRISRLEKLLRTKNESLDPQRVSDVARDDFNTYIASSDRWGYDKRGELNFLREFDALSDGRNRKLVDELFNMVAQDLGVTPVELQPYRSDIVNIAVDEADNVLYYHCLGGGDGKVWAAEIDRLGITPDEMPEYCRDVYLRATSRSERFNRRFRRK